MFKAYVVLMIIGTLLMMSFVRPSCGCDSMSGGTNDDTETMVQSIGIMVDILDQPSIIYPLGSMILGLIVFKAVRFKRDMRRRRIRKDRELRELKRKLEYEYAMRK